jgi:hypothetical protein
MIIEEYSDEKRPQQPLLHTKDSSHKKDDTTLRIHETNTFDDSNLELQESAPFVEFEIKQPKS